MSDIAVFYIEATDRERRWLRRYRWSSKSACGASGVGYCNAEVPIEDGPQTDSDARRAQPFLDDPRWPTHCACGHEFTEQDERQLLTKRIYRRPDTGEEMTLRDAPAGACWNATWFAERRSPPCFDVGDDGRCLVVKTPGGEWMIDSRARNCTMPDDNTHKCWVRHGRPEDGTLHVDKNGHTCGAGAGSILAGSYHGFLHHGRLTQC